MVRRTFVFVVLLLCCAAESRALTASEVIDRVEARYASTDCQSRFYQESTLKAMDVTDTAAGMVYFKKPNMMRWDYETPDRHTIVTDGKRLWMYRPDEAQVMVGQADDYFGDGEGLSFLADISVLRSRFDISFPSSEEKERKHHLLLLTPRIASPNLSTLYLWVSVDTFDIVRSKVVNSFGDTTTITFGNIRFSRGLKPSFFVFDIPKGTEVLKMDTNDTGW